MTAKRCLPTVNVWIAALLLGPHPALSWVNAESDLPAGRWVQLQKDAVGARRGSAVRYVPDAHAFFLWGFMNADPDLLQEQPLIRIPEYDMVVFNLADRQWRNHFPKAWQSLWSQRLPLASVPRTYSGITSGSERSILRGPSDQPGSVPRPDLNIVFDQVAYRSASRSLFYFTGGLTAVYDVERRHWSDLVPRHSPPPVLGGSLAYDPTRDQMVLFGGGNVVEVKANPERQAAATTARPNSESQAAGLGGRLVGYTGTWVYSFGAKDWRQLPRGSQPPPRMNTRMVCDTKNQVLVVFGGDGQCRYLADTWTYDLKAQNWRQSRAANGPEPRAGHFTVFDPRTGWVIIGGGYNRRDLTDMWAYDAREEVWRKLPGEVPTGFYVTADIAPEKRLILLIANTRRAGDNRGCNALYPVRTTYAYRIGEDVMSQPVVSRSAGAHTGMPKRPVIGKRTSAESDSVRRNAQAKRLRDLVVNRWILLNDPGRVAPARTWGSATFDTDRGQILYWGGGHCGYGGNDVDTYDIGLHTWTSSSEAPEYPGRLWDHGVRLAGVTFRGGPWTTHGRKSYAYDPISHKMVMVRPIRLTTGYLPEGLRRFPGRPRSRSDALIDPPSSYSKYVTWTFDPSRRQWDILAPAPIGLDTLVTTRRGVMGVNVDWPSRLNDAGYQLPWSPSGVAEDKTVYQLDAAQGRWHRLGDRQPCPQNLYEMTSLAYDCRRDQIILHGAGKNRDQLWTFDLKTNRWNRRQPTVAAPAHGRPPICLREAVYIPDQDVFLTLGPSPESRSVPALWACRMKENAWYRTAVQLPSSIEPRLAAGQNRALVYDPRRDLVLLVLGAGGDKGRAIVCAMRYRHER